MIKLARIDVLRLVHELPYLLHHVRLAVQPRQVVARSPVRGWHQVVLELTSSTASHEEHLPAKRVGGPAFGQHADDVEVSLLGGGVESEVAEHICCSGIRTRLQQCVERTRVTLFSSEPHRRSV